MSFKRFWFNLGVCCGRFRWWKTKGLQEIQETLSKFEQPIIRRHNYPGLFPGGRVGDCERTDLFCGRIEQPFSVMRPQQRQPMVGRPIYLAPVGQPMVGRAV
jgi:hypothetical protein